MAMKHSSLLFFILYPIIATADEATEGAYCYPVDDCSYCPLSNYCSTRGWRRCCSFPSADPSLHDIETIAARQDQAASPSLSSSVSGDSNNDQAAQLVFVDEATEELVCYIQECSDCPKPNGTCLTHGRFPLCCYPSADNDIPSEDRLIGKETIAARHDRDSTALRGYKN